MGEFEFPTMGHIWLAQEKRRAKVQFLRARNGTITVEDYAREVDDQTRIVPVTGVSFMNGIRSDAKALTDLAHSRGALVMLDDYQDCGTRPINVKELGVDFYLTGALKYLLASAGLGFLYVREDLIEKLVPIQSSWIAQRDAFAYRVDRLDLAPTARRFEIGTPPIPNIYAAAAAMDYLTRVGLGKIRDHVSGLTDMFMEGVRALGIEMKTPTDSVGPLVVLKTKDVGAVLVKLEQSGIIASSRFDGLRVSFHLYNNQQDVCAVLEVLESNRDLMVTSDQHAVARQDA
jgi:selenocysteine lyase/cysteine desulfurase